MRWKSPGVLAVFLVAMAADVSARQSPPPPPPGPATFSGRVVVDSVSTPIQGAFVELVGTVLRGVTDSSGAFSIIEVPAGTYVVRVRATGFHDELFEVEVVDGEDLEGVIALQRARREQEARSEKGEVHGGQPGPPSRQRLRLLASPFGGLPPLTAPEVRAPPPPPA